MNDWIALFEATANYILGTGIQAGGAFLTLNCPQLSWTKLSPLKAVANLGRENLYNKNSILSSIIANTCTYYHSDMAAALRSGWKLQVVQKTPTKTLFVLRQCVNPRQSASLLEWCNLLLMTPKPWVAWTLHILRSFCACIIPPPPPLLKSY